MHLRNKNYVGSTTNKQEIKMIDRSSDSDSNAESVAIHVKMDS